MPQTLSLIYCSPANSSQPTSVTRRFCVADHHSLGEVCYQPSLRRLILLRRDLLATLRCSDKCY